MVFLSVTGKIIRAAIRLVEASDEICRYQGRIISFQMKQKDKNNMWKIFAFFKLDIMLLFVGFKDIQYQ